MSLESDHRTHLQLQTAQLREHLCRMARFGANLADAYTCAIFLPSRFIAPSRSPGHSSPANVASKIDPRLSPPTSHSAAFGSERSLQGSAGYIVGTASNQGRDGPADDYVEVAGHHSLSTSLVMNARIARGNGLIGWVAKHNRSIHVSPFERDSRTLGIYSEDQLLKSFIGIPVNLGPNGANGSGDDNANIGVIACDSKKSFAFSKLQGKLLEDLAAEVATTVRLTRTRSTTDTSRGSWDLFLRRGTQIIEGLGAGSVDVLRLRPKNFTQIEVTAGTATAMSLLHQIQRLIEQALPPHAPVYALPNGDILLVVDNMMTAFFQNKIRALCEHVKVAERSLELEFIKSDNRGRQRSKGTDLETLIRETAEIATSHQEQTRHEQGKVYEYRRA